MSRFQIVLAGEPNRLVFAELQDSLAWGLRALGHDVTTGMFPEEGQRRAIILAPHLLLCSREGEAWMPPEGTIVYNFEPACSNLFERSLRLLGAPGVVAWDYAVATTDALRKLGVQAKHVPFAFAPVLQTLPKKDKDIDVVFCGSESPRRAALMRELLSKGLGLSLRLRFGVFGPERDELLARACVVLNAHFFAESTNEDLRILYAVANGLAVSSEGPPDEARKVGWARWAPIKDLVQNTLQLARSGEWQEQRERGARALRESPDVREVLCEALKD